MDARVGLALGYDPKASVAQMAQSAADAERHGFAMVFFSETIFTNRDSVSALAAFALSTRGIALGATQVVRLRSPLLMAQTAATLDELSDGRLVLALGAYVAMHAAKNGVELTDPLPTLREYVAWPTGLLHPLPDGRPWTSGVTSSTWRTRRWASRRGAGRFRSGSLRTRRAAS